MADEEQTPEETPEPTPAPAETPAPEATPAAETPAEAKAPAAKAEKAPAAKAEDVPAAEAEATDAPAAKADAPAAKADTPAAKADTPAAKADAPAAKADAPAAKADTPAAKANAPASATGDAAAAPAVDGMADEGEGKPEGEAAEGEGGAEATKRKPKVRLIKGAKGISSGIAHIKATFNNTIVSITDNQGNVISWGSAGRSGFKGSRKSTAYAASMVAQDAARQAMGHGMQDVEVRVQGPGAGRESAIRAIQSAGLNVHSIKDVTPIPHNGCRPKKRRRV